MSCALSSAVRLKRLSTILLLSVSTTLSGCGMDEVRRPMADVGSGSDTAIASRSLASEENQVAVETQTLPSSGMDQMSGPPPDVISVPDTSQAASEPIEPATPTLQPSEAAPEIPRLGETKPYSLPEMEPPSDDDKSYGYLKNYSYPNAIRDPIARGESVLGMSGGEMACRTELKRLGVVFQEKPPINDGGACRIDHPLAVSGFASGNIKLKPTATLNCQMTLAFARWVKGDLSPSTRLRYLSGINTIHQASSYSCRTMSSQRGRPMSEHARGNALDIAKITLNNGREIEVERPGLFSFRQRGLLNTVRSDACDYFTTVLGPGYDRFHSTHFHFDLMQRRSGHRACR
ncbi:Uncharacterized conserved protein [Phyllobacterium sp. YR620]|uniref:extensin-like domain-containing protein n=1 Tax=Phyllobacterium sp. YR620 TaxID=1881066 RepID=UPI0008886275|nr:Uncharacterized conserved protein [Phyllobacterium sp. YR620]